MVHSTILRLMVLSTILCGRGASAFLLRATKARRAVGSPCSLLPPRFMTTGDVEGADDPDAALFTELSRVEIRVGRIVDVSTHPTLDKIFVEQIELGEEEPRTICSGLQGFLTQEDLLGKDCVVVCNLKPRWVE